MSPFFNPTFLISILIALSVHEWAHAFVANKLGDPTARNMGRLTLNPIAHLDPLGTILFLTVGFGWGKPVPINPGYFKHPKRDTAIVSLAGPFSNFILAILCFVGLALVDGGLGSARDLRSADASGNVGKVFLQSLFASSLFLNLALMAFNLLPVAPLDGSKILGAFIPLRYEDEYDRFMHYGPYVLLGLLLAERLVNFSLLSGWITAIMDGVLRLFVFAFGGLL